jgi:hypothetical protein
VPIFELVMQSVWSNVAPKTALAPPSPEAKRQLACKSIDRETGERHNSGGKAITECLRVDAKGKVLDTQFQLVSRESAPEHDGESGKKVSAARNASTPAPQDPWRTQQQWGWQWGSGQQWREERRQWRSSQPTWGTWR